MTINIPLETQSMRCMDFALANAADPGGTGLAPDVVVLVEVPEPWPKPAGKHESMIALVSVAQHHHEQVRLLAAVPHDAAALRAIAFRPTDAGMIRTERPLGDDPTGAFESVLAGGGDEVLSADGITTMLVCTQGSHDVCCGTAGVEFAEWSEAEGNVEVFRVSHTGGHRFSPTAMTLPDGRMWAYLTPESAAEIVHGRSDAALVAAQCRGWWGASTGPAQIAERAVFATLGFGVDALPRSVEVEQIQGRNEVVVRAGDETFDVSIEAGREMPSIGCGNPGGQPMKVRREWSIVAGPTKR